MSDIKLTAFGGAEEVTGSNFMLQTPAGTLLVDCGMSQGNGLQEGSNGKDFLFNPALVSVILVTHSHIDHVGRLGTISAAGFSGTVYSTPETKELAALMLNDALRLEIARAEKESRRPVFTERDVIDIMSRWEVVSYYKDFSPLQGVGVTAYDAGHILGSAMYLVKVKQGALDKSILFTGDLGNSPAVLLKDTDKVPYADYVLMESVYGDRLHENRDKREEILLETLKRAVSRKATVIIPVFSLERTQEMLFLLDNFIEGGKLTSVPVFLDSPLAIKITEEYERAFDLYNESAREEIRSGDKIFRFSRLKETAKRSQSENIAAVPGPKIILAGSGMSTGGRVLSHEIKYLPDSNAMIIFTGYQSPGTLGRQIEEGAGEVMIDDKPVSVRAEVVTIKGFSGHRDSDGLTAFVEGFEPKPKRVFVAMGELKSATFLSQRLKDEVGVEATVMQKGVEYVL